MPFQWTMFEDQPDWLLILCIIIAALSIFIMLIAIFNNLCYIYGHVTNTSQSNRTDMPDMCTASFPLDPIIENITPFVLDPEPSAPPISASLHWYYESFLSDQWMNYSSQTSVSPEPSAPSMIALQHSDLILNHSTPLVVNLPPEPSAPPIIQQK